MESLEEKKHFEKTEVDPWKMLVVWVFLMILTFPILILGTERYTNDSFTFLMFIMMTGIISIGFSINHVTDKDYQEFVAEVDRITKGLPIDKWLNEKRELLEGHKIVLSDLKSIASENQKKLISPNYIVERKENIKPFQKYFQGMDMAEISRFCDIVNRYYPVSFRGIETSELRRVRDDYKRTKKSMDQLLNQYVGQLNLQQKKFKMWNSLLDLLQSFREGIPVNIARIAVLIKLDQNLTQELLQMILLQHPEIGEYLELEQAFIRGSVDDITSFKLERFTRAISSSFQICSTCGEELDLLKKSCPKCGLKLPICDVCKLGYKKEDDLSKCPSCNTLFHYTHLHEIVRISGKCPTCKVDLKEVQVTKITNSS